VAKIDSKWVDLSNLKYVSSITWSGSGPYTMTIPASTHGRGLNPIVVVRVTDTGVSSDCTWDVSVVDFNGSITITSQENFAGKIVIL